MAKGKRFDLFRPLKKGDRARCAYLGLDGSCAVLFERHTPLGRQEYVKATTKLANLRHVSVHGTNETRTLYRIVLHEYELGLLSVPLATGKPFHIEVWLDNSSENTKQRGFVNQTITIEVPGLGCFSTNCIPGLVGSGFTLQGPGLDSILGATEPWTAGKLREWNAAGKWGDDTKIVEFDDPNPPHATDCRTRTGDPATPGGECNCGVGGGR